MFLSNWYATDDITVWASGVKILELEHMINGYLTEMSCFLQDNSLWISVLNSTVTLFTANPMQVNTNPKIKILDTELPLVRNPKLLGVYLDTFFSFNAHCVQVADRVSKRNNVLKALGGTNWGQQEETKLLTYKPLGSSIANYSAPVWSTNTSDTRLEKIQRTHNEALRIITGSHKMTSFDHLHSETKMLLVEDHLNHLSAQYLVHCLDTDHVCHHITTLDHPPREMKEILFTKHNQTVLPLLANTKKESLRALYTSFVNTAIDNMTDNRVWNYRPPPINDAPATASSWTPTKRDWSRLILQVVQTVEWIHRMFITCSTALLTPSLWHLKKCRWNHIRHTTSYKLPCRRVYNIHKEND